MAVRSEERQLQDEKVRAALDEIEEKGLVKWYRRWHNEPLTYAVAMTLAKVPFYLLILAVVSWEKIEPFFSDPFLYLKERIVLLAVSFFAFTILFHFAWKGRALTYYLLAKLNAQLELHDDSRVSVYGRKASRKLPVHYHRWGRRWWMLTALLALAVPAAFFSIFYLIHGLKENQWSAQAYFSIFEEGTDVFVFAVFFFLGALMGFGIWKEINKNFHLLQKIDANRE